MSVIPTSIDEAGFLRLAEIAEKTRGLAARAAAKGRGFRARANVPGIFSPISPSTILGPPPPAARALSRLPDLAAGYAFNPTRAS
jgi:hypothetical protein